MPIERDEDDREDRQRERQQDKLEWRVGPAGHDQGNNERGCRNEDGSAEQPRHLAVRSVGCGSRQPGSLF
jgi:hypothetical protein